MTFSSASTGDPPRSTSSAPHADARIGSAVGLQHSGVEPGAGANVNDRPGTVWPLDQLSSRLSLLRADLNIDDSLQWCQRRGNTA